MVVLFLLASRYDKISGLCRYTYTGTSVSGLRRKKKKIPDVRSQKSIEGAKKQKQQRIIWVTLTGSSSRMCDEWG